MRNKHRLVIAPDRMLTLVPFALLPGGSGREFLLETRTVSYIPSGGDLLRFEEAGLPLTKAQLVAVGSPDFTGMPSKDAALRGKRALCTLDEGVTFDPLPGTMREVSAIEKLAATETGSHPTILTGPQATKARLLQAAPGKAILHLATHAYFAGPRCQRAGGARTERHSLVGDALGPAGEDPLLLAGLALAGANKDPAGGILTAFEVASLDLRDVKLVVLSACDTGLGRLNPGQELLGLRWAFAFAGARTLVTSLWQVPDEPTAALMTRFYEGLWRYKLAPTAALRDAQLVRLRTNRAQGNPRPWEWGTFTVSGPVQ